MKKDDIQKWLDKGKRRGKHLEHLRMLQEIDKLVETDFCFEMELKELPKSKPYTQKEAKEMSNLLGKIYLISHCLHCTACQTKFIKVINNL